MGTPHRRAVLATAATGLAGVLTGCTGPSDSNPGGNQYPPNTDADLPDAVGVNTVVSGLRAPVDVAFPPEEDRLYVVEQGGRILRHESDGTTEQFLDIRDAVDARGNEMGLLGLALHPSFVDNQRFFVRYSAPPRPGTPSGYSHTFVLAEFEASVDGTEANRNSERTILEIPEPQSNHNAGNVLFGPDGYLYVGVGDGGAGGDQGGGHVEDWYDDVGGGNGQDVTENLLGSILRLDVDTQDGSPYAIPDGNPLVGTNGLDEHYAWGLRNPWGMSFDSGRFFVADVGQNRYEEVNIVENGGNYGWNVREATHCYQASSCPERTPDDVRGGEPLLSPIVEYGREGPGLSGRSVIGGHVYRGSAVPGLTGAYVFGDLVAGGRLFVATPPESSQGTWPAGVLTVQGTLDRILAFGQDPDGEVYVLGSGPDGMGVYRIATAG